MRKTSSVKAFNKYVNELISEYQTTGEIKSISLARKNACSEVPLNRFNLMSLGGMNRQLSIEETESIYRYIGQPKNAMIKINKCKVCGLEAPADAFPKGRRLVCKTCYYEQVKEYRKKLKEKRGNTYTSDACAEKRRAYQREYVKKHKDDEVFKQKKREWSRRHRELLKERKRLHGSNR